MFRIKICGVTSPADALAATELGADAIGLNFYERSPRFLSLEAAEAIAHSLPQEVARVGVFVNAPLPVMEEHVGRLGLTHLQLHGDESPEIVSQLAPIPVVKAFRLGEEGIDPIMAWLDRAAELGAIPDRCLIDAHRPDQYGGTGATADWRLAANLAGRQALNGLVLAGGLTSANVGAAIAAVRPGGVDTASGVESSPGRKDRAKLRAFITAARTAFDRLTSP